MTHHPAAVGETFVFAGREILTTSQMVSQVSSALGRTVPAWRVPLLPVRLAAISMERTLKPLRIKPPLHQRRLDFFVKSYAFDTAKARTLLGFEPTIPFSRGAVECADWYREQQLLSAPRPAAGIERAQLHPQETFDVVPLVDAARGPWQPADILEYTHDAIIIWELGGQGICYWNRAAESLYGYTRHEAHGKTTHSLLRTQLPGGIDHLESQLSRYGIWFGELRHTARNGAPVIVQARLALMAQQNGRWLVLEVNRDITRVPQSSDAQSAAQSYVRAMR